MKSNEKLYLEKDIDNITFDGEIDLKQIFDCFLRNKKIIAVCSALGIFIGGIYASSLKNVWQGQFQIVLSSEEQSSVSKMFANSNAVGSFGSLLETKASKDLKTEVEILKSPSVLLPVFNFVKTDKKSKGYDVKDWRYSKWLQDNLNIEIEKGTTVLNVSYEDTDKEIIPIILDKISKTYQKYSGSARSKGISKGINLLQKQLDKYKLISLKSMTKKEKFLIDQNYSEQVEIERVKSANKLNLVKEQSKKFNSLVDKAEQKPILYFVQLINPLFADMVTSEIEFINKELAIKRLSFLEKNKDITYLKEKKDALIKTLIDNTQAYLQSEESIALSRLDSFSRSKEVMVEYKLISYQAERDQTKVSTLEIELGNLMLEKARDEDPWELITDPTLLDRPVAPGRIRIISIGFLLAFIISSLFSIQKDKREGIIYNEKILSKLLGKNQLETFSIFEFNEWDNQIRFISKLIKFETNESKISIVPVGDISNQTKEEFSKKLKSNFKNKNLVFSDDLYKIDGNNIILVIELGKIKYKQMNQLIKVMQLTGIKSFNWILFDSNEKIQFRINQTFAN